MMDLLQAIESSGFSQWVKQSGSLWAFPGILLLHTYGMAVLVGIIAGIDLRILGLMPAVPLAPLRRLMPLVWAAFWVNAITGTMLLAADATTKMRNLDFGIKMAFIVLAVITQRVIQKRVFGDPDLDRQPSSSNAKMLAVMSLVCWLGAITAGRLLAYVGNPGGL
jgi:SNF family Na+-dependent transporter